MLPAGCWLLVAGFCGFFSDPKKVMSNPVDVAKTRLMNQRPEEGKPLSLGYRERLWCLENQL